MTNIELRLERRKRHISREALAYEMGIGYVYISQLETGHCKFTLEREIQYLDCLGKLSGDKSLCRKQISSSDQERIFAERVQQKILDKVLKYQRSIKRDRCLTVGENSILRRIRELIQERLK